MASVPGRDGVHVAGHGARAAPARISRAAALSSTTSTRSCAELLGNDLARCPWPAPTPSQTVKKKVLPTPGSLSSQICPPISSTSRRQMVRPRPVPPCLRVVDMSACVNGWNSFAACSGVMPMPVSRTENLSCTFSPVRSSSSIFSRISPLLGELDGVVDEVGQDLAEPQRVAQQVLRDVRRDVRQELQALLVRLLGGERGDGADDLVEPEVGGLDVELAGLDLREVEDVVDDGQQRRAGVVDLADVVALLGGELGLEREVRQADDGVHRRADLVAHVREEHGLHLRGFLGLLPWRRRSPSRSSLKSVMSWVTPYMSRGLPSSSQRRDRGRGSRRPARRPGACSSRWRRSRAPSPRRRRRSGARWPRRPWDRPRRSGCTTRPSGGSDSQASGRSPKMAAARSELV